MYTYLIIDDEPLIRKGTIKKLSSLSDQVTCCGEAEDGKEGLELIRRLQPDFVILDMQMPILNGMELLPFLASHYPDMPLIVISAYQNFEYVKQAITSRAIDYILKPFFIRCSPFSNSRAILCTRESVSLIRIFPHSTTLFWRRRTP